MVCQLISNKRSSLELLSENGHQVLDLQEDQLLSQKEDSFMEGRRVLNFPWSEVKDCLPRALRENSPKQSDI